MLILSYGQVAGIIVLAMLVGDLVGMFTIALMRVAAQADRREGDAA